jgi:hypothetical protein
MAPILLFLPELRTLAFLFHWPAEHIYKTVGLIHYFLIIFKIIVRFCGSKCDITFSYINHY